MGAWHRPRLPRQHVRLPGRRGDPARDRHHRGTTPAHPDRRPARRRRAHRPARRRAQTRRHVHLARPASRRTRATRPGPRPADGAQQLLQPRRPVRRRRDQHTPVAGRGMPVHQRARHRARRRPRLRRADQPGSPGHRRSRRPGRSHHRAGVRPGPGPAPAVPLRPRLPAHPARTAHRPRPGHVRPLRRRRFARLRRPREQDRLRLRDEPDGPALAEPPHPRPGGRRSTNPWRGNVSGTLTAYRGLHGRDRACAPLAETPGGVVADDSDPGRCWPRRWCWPC